MFCVRTRVISQNNILERRLRDKPWSGHKKFPKKLLTKNDPFCLTKLHISKYSYTFL